MAEILIYAGPNKNGLRRGMPVAVEEDGHTWGAKEGPNLPPADGGMFAVLRITDVTKAQVKARLVRLRQQDPDPDVGQDLEDRYPVRANVRWRLFVENLPQSVIRKLNRDGIYTANLNQVRAYIRRLRALRGQDVEDTDEEEF